MEERLALIASPFIQASEDFWDFRSRATWVFVFANNNNEKY